MCFMSLVSQPVASKHQNKLDVLFPAMNNHPLAPAFLHPPHREGELITLHWLKPMPNLSNDIIKYNAVLAKHRSSLTAAML